MKNAECRVECSSLRVLPRLARPQALSPHAAANVQGGFQDTGGLLAYARAVALGQALEKTLSLGRNLARRNYQGAVNSGRKIRISGRHQRFRITQRLADISTHKSSGFFNKNLMQDVSKFASSGLDEH
jgi:hypothetical protein